MQERQTKLRFWDRLGAGFVTGAADDDPSGIATYSQVGAKFGYAMLWMVLLTTPLMIAIQMVSARIGCARGRGLADTLMQHFPSALVWFLVALLTIANVINVGADLSAMGASAQLLMGGSRAMYAIAFAVLSAGLQVGLTFKQYAPILKTLALSLFAYVATVFVVKVQWVDALHAFFIPHIAFNKTYLIGVVAVLGTTISPYLFYWQAAQEVEEIHDIKERIPLIHDKYHSETTLRRIGIDTTIGMVFSNAMAFFMIVTAAAVLHAHGKTNIQSAAEAAQALRPIAGPFAFFLFSAGIVSTGLLAVPVLTGATAYAIAGAARKPYGLARKPKQAPLFYAVLIGSMIVGAAISCSPIDPIKALYGSAVVNGVCAVPLMAAIMIVAVRHQAMGKHIVRGWLLVGGWAATVLMAAAVIVMFLTFGQ